jgi:hypothetical protein
MDIEFSSWKINLNDNVPMDFFNSIDDYLIYSNTLNVNFLLNHNNVQNQFSSIEKLIYDIVVFHCNRLNINLNDKHVSFWSKTEKYNFDYIHMHVDHCDYECRMHNTMYKKPIFTTLIYLNNNINPTLITQFTENTNIYTNQKQLIFSFPKLWKNICFNPKLIHGESYITQNDCKERKCIVIAVWDKNDKPLHVPYFDPILFNYYRFTHKQCVINPHVPFNKNTSYLTFEDTTHNNVNIYVNETFIDDEFFNELLNNKTKTVMYKFGKIFENFNNLDTFTIKPETK